MSKKNTKVAVVGAGPGGYAAAFMAADLGLEVTLIDPEENPGGVCLYRGCIPSKALLHVAGLINESKSASDWGVNFNAPKINIKKMRDWKNEVVGNLTGGLGGLTKQRKIDYVRGTARFVDATTLKVTPLEGEDYQLEFEHAIVATGSRPTVLPGMDTESQRILDSTSALDLKDVPKSLLVIGGGYIGLELGTVYAALGTKVSVVEMTPGLLPGADRDLVNTLKRNLEDKLDSIQLETTVTGFKEQKNGIKVSLKDKDGETSHRIFEKVLVSIGRKPNTEDLGLENTNVQVDERGFVIVDEQRRTNEPSIFAIGDIAGEPMLAHKASHEGKIAAEVISGREVVYAPRAIPAVVFTDPEIAWCGVTQDEAKAKKLEVEVVRFPWAASGRAMTLGRTDGLTKLIVEKKSGRVLGVGLVGHGAGELIAEGVLAMEMAATVEDIDLSVHPHPTMSETFMEAAGIFAGTSTHYYRPKRKS